MAHQLLPEHPLGLDLGLLHLHVALGPLGPRDQVRPLLLVAGLGIADGLGTDRHLGRVAPHRRPLQRSVRCCVAVRTP